MESCNTKRVQNKINKLTINLSHLKPSLNDSGLISDLYIIHAAGRQLKPRVCKVLIDSGAAGSIVSRKNVFMSKINLVKIELELIGVTGTRLNVLGKAEIDLIIENQPFKHEFIICDDDIAISAHMILGCDFLKRFKAVPILHEHILKFDTFSAPLYPLKSSSPMFEAEINTVQTKPSTINSDKQGQEKTENLDCITSRRTSKNDISKELQSPGLNISLNDFLNLPEVQINDSGEKQERPDTLANCSPGIENDSGVVSLCAQRLASLAEGKEEQAPVVSSTNQNKRKGAETPALKIDECNAAKIQSTEVINTNRDRAGVQQEPVKGATIGGVNSFNAEEVLEINDGEDYTEDDKVFSAIVDNDFVYSSEDKIINCDTNEELLSKFNFSQIPHDLLERVKCLIIKYRDLFLDKTKRIGKVPNFEANIKLKPNIKPIKRRHYPMAFALRPVLKQKIAELLAQGVLVPSEGSQWASPLMLIPKKICNGEKTWRIVFNFKEVNNCIEDETWPIYGTRSIIANIGSANNLTVLDLSDSFHHLALNKNAQDVLTVICEIGIFKPVRMLQGLKISPVLFAKCMSFVLEGLDNVLNYVDDIIIRSDTLEQHMESLEAVFARLLAYNFKINPSKAQLFQKSVTFLGHKIEVGVGITIDPAKNSLLRAIPYPKNASQTRQALSFFSFYRESCEDFAFHAKPLTELTRKGVPFIFTEVHEAAFEAIRSKLLNATALQFPDLSKPFLLSTDCSNYQMGACLSQLDDKNIERPISFYSKILNKNQINFSATEKEILAAILSIRRYRCYIYLQSTQLITDCAALSFGLRPHLVNTRMIRWSLELNSYNLTIVHRAGSQHINADYLSRVSLNIIQAPEKYDDLEIVWDASTILKAQLLDPYIKKLKQQLVDEGSKLVPSYFTDSRGILFKARQGEERHSKFVAPASMVHTILNRAHCSVFGGHRSGLVTHKMVSRQFYWPNQYTDTMKFCRSCEVCNKFKINKQDKLVPLGKFDREQLPFSHCHFDLAGPFNISSDNSKYVLLYICSYSKYADFIPLPDIRSFTIAEALVSEIFLRWGVPRVLVSDRGTSLISDVMDELFKLLKCDRDLTTAYNSRGNGMVEKLVSTFKSILSTLARDNPQSWHKYLNFTKFIYNNSIHASTKESPHFIVFLNDIRFPFSFLHEPQYDRKFYNYDTSYRNLMIKRAKETFAVVTTNLQKAQITQKLQYDKHTKNKKIEVGGRVYLRKEALEVGIAKGLQPKFTGPYRVLKSEGPQNWAIKQIYGNQKTLTVHANRIKVASEPDESHLLNEIDFRNQLKPNSVDNGQKTEVYVNSDGEEVEIISREDDRNSICETSEEAKSSKYRLPSPPATCGSENTHVLLSSENEDNGNEGESDWDLHSLGDESDENSYMSVEEEEPDITNTPLQQTPTEKPHDHNYMTRSKTGSLPPDRVLQ